MDKEVKELWLTALRSGEYQQAKGALRRKDDDEFGTGYCCLGVLCDIAAKQGVCSELEYFGEDSEVDRAPGYYIPTKMDDDGEYQGATLYNCAFPPDHVREWAGLDDHQQNDLAQINDESSDFSRTIEYIESNL